MSARVTCADCAFGRQADSLVEASDLAEAHSQKEVGHDVDIQRAVADGGEELVWVISGRITRCGTYHRDPDCHSLSVTDRAVQKPRSVLPEEATECERCGGDWSPPGGPGKLDVTRQLEQADPDDLATDGGTCRDVGGAATPPAGYGPGDDGERVSSARLREAIHFIHDTAVGGWWVRTDGTVQGLVDGTEHLRDWVYRRESAPDPECACWMCGAEPVEDLRYCDGHRSMADRGGDR